MVRKVDPIRRGLKLFCKKVKPYSFSSRQKGRPDKKGIETSVNRGGCLTPVNRQKGRPDKKGIETFCLV